MMIQELAAYIIVATAIVNAVLGTALLVVRYLRRKKHQAEVTEFERKSRFWPKRRKSQKMPFTTERCSGDNL